MIQSHLGLNPSSSSSSSSHFLAVRSQASPFTSGLHFPYLYDGIMTPASYMMQNAPHSGHYHFTNVSILFTVDIIGTQLKLAPIVPLLSWSLCGKSQTWLRSAKGGSKEGPGWGDCISGPSGSLFLLPPWNLFLAECLGD